ncbi:hypothetical protein [Methanobrevibacter arboriphilus]|nr:hypothetical protein [Methanobrevibacter arboriphilus]
MIFMPPKSKVEKSPHFNEILDMIEKSISPRHISDYLKNEYNESISHTAINNFVKKIKSKTASEYYKQQKVKEKDKKSKVDEVVDKELANKEAIDDVVNKGVSDLDALDTIISEAENVGLDIDSLYVEEGPRGGIVTSQADIVKIQILVKRLGIDAIKAKAMILKDSPEPPDINVNINDLNNFFKKQREIAIEKATEEK